MHDRSADDVFYLAILALQKRLGKLIVFASARQSYPLVSQNLLLYKFHYQLSDVSLKYFIGLLLRCELECILVCLPCSLLSSTISWLV